MDVAVALEHRFARTPDGAIWTESFFARSFWHRYLSVFDGVRLIARVRDVTSAEDGWKRVDGPGIGISAMPYYVGPAEYLLRRAEIVKAARAAIPADSAVILRVSSQIANCLEPVLRRSGHPFAVEVVADPYGIFAPGAIRHPLRPLLRWWFPMRLRRQCRGACAASYVTRETLQSLYPPKSGAFRTHYSSVELGPECFVETPRTLRAEGPLRLIFAGTLEADYKGPDILLQALSACRRDGLDFQLEILGDGRRRKEMEALAASLGIDRSVHFAGLLPAGPAVRERFDRADLFILPSRQEGLPRAMIEAMARGLPCIGTTVGGIPELLTPCSRVPPGDAGALASKILDVARNPTRLVRMSRRNLAAASEYRDEFLNQRRKEFYCYLKEATRDWLAQSEKWPARQRIA
jgi:glycosyltransferase involved in cell wall biosynthesis